MSVTFGDSFANTGSASPSASTTASDRRARRVGRVREHVADAPRRSGTTGSPRPRSTRSRDGFRAAAAAAAYSSTLRPQIDAITRAPRASSAGRSCAIHASTPGPGRPTEFSIPPPGASVTRSGGLPSHANAATDFAVTAPSPRGSHSAATSAPCPNVPDAATIGFGKRERPELDAFVDGRVRAFRATAARHRAQTSNRSWPSRWYSCSERTSGSRLTASAMPGRGGDRGRDRRDARDAVHDRGPPDVHAVGPRAPAARRVHDQVDLARGDQVDRVDARPVLADLGHDRVDRDPARLEHRGGAGGRRDREAELGEAAGRDEPGLPCRGRRARGTPCPCCGSVLPAPAWLFANAMPNDAVDAHHLAGRAHLGAEERVDVGEAVERQHRFLDRRRGRLRRAGASRPSARSSASVAPTISRAATFASGTPVALLTNGTVRLARGFASMTNTSPSFTAYCTLSRPDDVERAGERARVLLDRLRARRRQASAAGSRTRSRPSARPPPRCAP